MSSSQLVSNCASISYTLGNILSFTNRFYDNYMKLVKEAKCFSDKLHIVSNIVPVKFSHHYDSDFIKFQSSKEQVGWNSFLENQNQQGVFQGLWPDFPLQKELLSEIP